MSRELFKDLVKYLPTVIVPALAGIVLLPVITHLFPPDSYGNYVLVMTTVAVFSIISVTWLSSAVSRFLPIYEKKKETKKFSSLIFKLSFLSIVLFSFLLWGALSIVQSYITTSLYALMRIGILLFIGSSFFKVFTQILQARRLPSWYSFFITWRSVIGPGFGIALVIFFHTGVDGLLWGIILSIALVFPLLWRVSIGMPSLRDGNIFSSTTLEIAKFGVPGIGINLLSWGLSLSDIYLLQFFRNSYEVAIYSANYSVSEKTIFLITSLFLLPSVPIAYKIWEDKGQEASREFVHNLTRYYLLISLPAVIGLSTLAKPISDILFPREYLLGYKIIPMVAVGALLVGLAQRFALGLGYYKRTDLNMICFLGSILLNIGLNLYFIPKYGYIAAAATTFASYAFLLLMTIIISRRYFVWKFPFKSLAKAIVASIVMGGVVYFISNRRYLPILLRLFLGVFAGILIYFIMLFLLREVNTDEIKSLLRVFDR